MHAKVMQLGYCNVGGGFNSPRPKRKTNNFDFNFSTTLIFQLHILEDIDPTAAVNKAATVERLLLSPSRATCPARRHVKKFMNLLLLVRRIPSGKYSSQSLPIPWTCLRSRRRSKEQKDNSLIDKKSCSTTLVAHERVSRR